MHILDSDIPVKTSFKAVVTKCISLGPKTNGNAGYVTWNRVAPTYLLGGYVGPSSFHQVTFSELTIARF